VHEIRKYKFYEIACSDVLFVVHRYHYKFVGLAGSGIDSATPTSIQHFISISFFAKGSSIMPS